MFEAIHSSCTSKSLKTLKAPWLIRKIKIIFLKNCRICKVLFKLTYIINLTIFRRARILKSMFEGSSLNVDLKIF